MQAYINTCQHDFKVDRLPRNACTEFANLSIGIPFLTTVCGPCFGAVFWTTERTTTKCNPSVCDGIAGPKRGPENGPQIGTRKRTPKKNRGERRIQNAWLPPGAPTLWDPLSRAANNSVCPRLCVCRCVCIASYGWHGNCGCLCSTFPASPHVFWKLCTRLLRACICADIWLGTNPHVNGFLAAPSTPHGRELDSGPDRLLVCWLSLRTPFGAGPLSFVSRGVFFTFLRSQFGVQKMVPILGPPIQS